LGNANNVRDFLARKYASLLALLANDDKNPF
jgi:hypothetical protein